MKRWREAGYPGAEQVTKQLLRHWASNDLPRRLFFCQREAAETIIYITEILASRRKPPWKQALSPEDFARLTKGERPSFVEAAADWFPRLIDPPLDGGAPLVRYGCKMATGSGKTVVMAMLVAWTLCNRGRRPADVRLPNGVAPNDSQSGAAAAPSSEGARIRLWFERRHLEPRLSRAAKTPVRRSCGRRTAESRCPARTPTTASRLHAESGSESSTIRGACRGTRGRQRGFPLAETHHSHRRD